jgi:WD40 repeat protein
MPDKLRGHALIKNFTENQDRLIEAHETGLACICLNVSGRLLATCSDKGTLIRIFLIDRKELIQELRRGIDRAEIYSLAFHSSSKWIACSSNTGTVHVYSIISEVQNRKLGLKFFKKLVPKYFESEWSYVHFKVKDVKTFCAFVGDELKIVVVSDDGMLYLVNFADKGKCVYEKQVNLMEMEMI